MVNLATFSTFSSGGGFSIISSKTEPSAEETVSPQEHHRQHSSHSESKTKDDPPSVAWLDVVPVSQDNSSELT